jgi:hypothetical protein
MRASAAEVLAICMSEYRPSCMRAPPVAAKHTSGMPCSRQRSAASVKRSPTTEPIDPPMKPNSNAQAQSSRPSRRPSIATSASFSPVCFCAARMRSR